MAAKKSSTPRRRRNLPIALSDKAQQLLKETRENTGMPMTLILERLLEWFVDQEDVVRASVLKSIPESIRTDVGRLALERLAGNK